MLFGIEKYRINKLKICLVISIFINGCFLFDSNKMLPAGVYSATNNGIIEYYNITGDRFVRVNISGQLGNRRVMIVTGDYQFDESDLVSFRTGTWNLINSISDTIKIDTVKLDPSTGYLGLRVRNQSGSSIDFGYESTNPDTTTWTKYTKYLGKLYVAAAG